MLGVTINLPYDNAASALNWSILIMQLASLRFPSTSRNLSLTTTNLKTTSWGPSSCFCFKNSFIFWKKSIVLNFDVFHCYACYLLSIKFFTWSHICHSGLLFLNSWFPIICWVFLASTVCSAGWLLCGIRLRFGEWILVQAECVHCQLSCNQNHIRAYHRVLNFYIHFKLKLTKIEGFQLKRNFGEPIPCPLRDIYFYFF